MIIARITFAILLVLGAGKAEQDLYTTVLGAWQQGRNGPAQLAAEQFLARFPDSTMTHQVEYIRDSCLFQTGKYSQAAAAFARFPSRYPYSEYVDDALFWAGRSEHKAGAFDRAIARYREVLTRFANGPMADDAMYQLAEAYADSGRNEQALSAYRRLLREFPESDLAPNAMYAAGWMLAQAGRHGEALKFFKRFLSRYPENRLADEVRFQVAESLYRLQDYNGCYSNFAALDSDGLLRGNSSERARFLMAESLFRMHRFGKAATAYEDLIGDNPVGQYHDDALYGLGWSLFSDGRIPEALKEFRRLMLKHKKSPLAHLAHFKAAECLEKLGDYRQAALEFVDHAKLFPGSDKIAESLVRAGRLYALMNKPEKAETIYSEVVTSHSKSPLVTDALYGIGWSLYKRRQYMRAADSFKLCRERQPGGPLAPEAAYLAADSMYRAKEWALAGRMFDELMSCYPKSPRMLDAKLGRAWCAWQQSSYDAAHDGFEYVFLNSKDPGTIFEAGRKMADSLYNLRRYSDALDAYTRLGDRFSKRADMDVVAMRQGQCLLKLGLHLRAADAFESLLNRYPSSRMKTKAMMAMAQSLAEAGGRDNLVRAAEQYRKVAEKAADPAVRAEALFRSGDCMYNAGLYEKSIADYRDTAKKYPDSSFAAEALYGLGWAYRQLGRTQDAVKAAEVFIEKYPQSKLASEVKLRLGEQYFRAKKIQRARALLQSVASSGSQRYEADARYLLAVMDHDAGNITLARKELITLLARYPDAQWIPEARLLLAKIRIRENNIDEAIVLLGDDAALKNP